MIEHLSTKQVEDYCRRRLGVAELLSVSDHMAACEACRGRAERAMNGDAAFFALRSELFPEAANSAAPHAARTHLTAEQLAEYVDGNLSVEGLQTVGDHLTACEQCALAVDDLQAFRDEIAPTLEREYHPAPTVPVPVAPLPSPVEGWRQRTAASLSALFRRPPRLAFGAALAALLLAVLGWSVWSALRGSGTQQEIAVSPSPTSPHTPISPQAPASPPTRTEQPAQPQQPAMPEQPVRPEQATLPEQGALPTQPAQPTQTAELVAQLNDGAGQLTLDKTGNLSGGDALPPAYQSMLKKALSTGRIERSAQLKGLARSSSPLMSAEKEGSAFSVLAPVGEVLLDERPTFRWSPMKGANAYVVEVYDGKFNLVATSPQLTGDSWAMPQALARGQVYSWQVKAVKDGQEFASPRPPAPQARFRILDRAKAAELAKAKRAYPANHLTLGLLYAEAGLLPEAERELRLLQKANPGSELARRLLNQIHSLRRRRD